MVGLADDKIVITRTGVSVEEERSAQKKDEVKLVIDNSFPAGLENPEELLQ